MLPDIQSPFGTYSPPHFLQRLIGLSQNAPRNIFGRQFAKWVRNKVVRQGQKPLDVAVGEIKLRCYLWNNYTERKFVFMPWRFDRRERAAIFAMLPKDGVFLDIGANVGVYTLEAATHLGAQGRVIALEPYPPVFDRLEFNIAATCEGRPDWPQIRVLKIGVADEAKTFDLHLNQNNLGQNSIVSDSPRDQQGGAVNVVSISCEPLLNILARESVHHIDVLKIDIEGAEDLALCPFLEAAPDSLLPKAILIENSNSQWQKDLVGMLKLRGYTARVRERMNTVYTLA